MTEIYGIPLDFLVKYKEKIEENDVTFILPEFEKLFAENYNIRTESRILKLRIKALEELLDEKTNKV